MVRIYISGGITKVKDYEKNFQDAETFLKENDIDNRLLYISKSAIKVINPVKLPHHHDKTWVSYMKECIESLAPCDRVYMLSGWWKSKGARIEWIVSKFLKMDADYQ